jgi:hypothetical protein
MSRSGLLLGARTARWRFPNRDLLAVCRRFHSQIASRSGNTKRSDAELLIDRATASADAAAFSVGSDVTTHEIGGAFERVGILARHEQDIAVVCGGHGLLLTGGKPR